MGREKGRGNTTSSSRARAMTTTGRMHWECDSNHGDRGADADEIIVMTGIENMQNDDDDEGEKTLR